MVVESDADLAVFFNSEEFGQAATFTPAAGPPSIDLTVILTRGREDGPLGELGVVANRTVARARAVDLSGVQVRGGSLVIGAEAFVVTKAELDERRRIYILGLRKT